MKVWLVIDESAQWIGGIYADKEVADDVLEFHKSEDPQDNWLVEETEANMTGDLTYFVEDIIMRKRARWGRFRTVEGVPPAPDLDAMQADLLLGLKRR